MRKETGFTMIELLISLLIMGIAFAGIFAMQSKLARSVHQNEHMSQGILLAASMLESITANPAGLRAFQLTLNNSAASFCTAANATPAKCGGSVTEECRAALASVQAIACGKQGDAKINQAAMLTNLKFTLTCGDGSAACVLGQYCGSGTENYDEQLCQDVQLITQWTVQGDNVDDGNNGLETKQYIMRTTL